MKQQLANEEEEEEEKNEIVGFNQRTKVSWVGMNNKAELKTSILYYSQGCDFLKKKIKQTICRGFMKTAVYSLIYIFKKYKLDYMLQFSMNRNIQYILNFLNINQTICCSSLKTAAHSLILIPQFFHSILYCF